jgi:phosphoribosylpyrophosphate synthetase
MNAFEDQPPDLPSIIAYSPATAIYSSEMIRELHDIFPDEVHEVEIDNYGDGSPIGKVKSADHVLYVTTFTGDKWRTDYSDLGLIGSTYTIDPDRAGKNSKRFGVFFMYLEGRQDRRQEKPITTDGDTIAITKNQSVSTLMLAKEIAQVAGADYVGTIALHSWIVSQQLKQAGLEHINTTLAPDIARTIEDHHFLDDNVPTMFGTVDVGNLNHVEPVRRILARKYADVSIAIIQKRRIAIEGSTKSELKQELVFGDVTGKRIILVDDVLSSARSLKKSAKLYFDHGAKEIVIIINHPVCVEDYYDNTVDLLLDGRVSLIMAANTLQFGRRGVRTVSLPYVKPQVGSDNGRREVQVLDVRKTITNIIGTILHTPSLDAARRQLGDYVWDVQDPAKLYEEITGKPYYPPVVSGVYDKGEIWEFPPKAEVFPEAG